MVRDTIRQSALDLVRVSELVHRPDLDLSSLGQSAKLDPTHVAYMGESFGTVVAYVVDVSIADGAPKLHAVTAGVHANQVVNPLAAQAQIQGGAVYGLAMTRPGYEITLKDGVVQQSQFSDYPPPRITDVPAVAVHFVASNDPPTGLGEPGVPPIAPAIANAIAALTGKRLRKLPFDLAQA